MNKRQVDTLQEAKPLYAKPSGVDLKDWVAKEEKEERNPEICRKLKELQYATESLAETCQKIEGRLELVLSPAPKNELGRANELPVTSLGQIIQSVTINIETLQDKLTQLISRIEL